MKYKILLNSVTRLPVEKASKLLNDYQKNEEFKDFAEGQQVIDIFTQKVQYKQRTKEEIIYQMMTALMFMTKRKDYISDSFYEELKGYPMFIWIEAIGILNDSEILKLLNNYHNEMPSSIIETCIIILNEENQLKTIERYKDNIDSKYEMYPSFYYSVCDKAREKLKSIFPDSIDDEILLELEDLDEVGSIEKLCSLKERVSKLPIDDIIEFVLLKVTKTDLMIKFIKTYKDEINKCSTPLFELLYTRFKYICDEYSNWIDNKDKLNNYEFLEMFKPKLIELGIEKCLKLFNVTSPYYSKSDFNIKLILEFIDNIYEDTVFEEEYVNEYTKKEVINRLIEKFNSKKYNLEDYEKLVRNIDKKDKNKYFLDDYMEAIIASRKLLEENIIDDKNPVFINLREKFINTLINRVEKDGTYRDKFNLNGLFYRIVKGKLPFYEVYKVKTYKGLIYLSRVNTNISYKSKSKYAEELIDDSDNKTNVDFITGFLTDEHLAKLDIKPLKNLIKNKIEDADYMVDESFITRIALQLLCYFGKEKAKYIMESSIRLNRMENLFDGLKYDEIHINDDGTPIVNEELLNFLFGNGSLKEPNSIINKMIKNEIPKFEKFFTEFCNNYEKIKEKCNGVLTLNRVINYFYDAGLPIKLKLDEKEFKNALLEMHTMSEALINEGIELCKAARERTYSTIPKVKGKIGDFTYEVLDLDDPLALAVGYLSHCCFVVGGISYSALKHSMKSSNGRTFVVYYKNQFLTQSWVWRNGDVVCFDSVESGSPYHGMKEDDIKLVDVYKKAANEILSASKKEEDELQQIKLVTVGRSDYTFNELKELEGDVPKTLEGNVYQYDSSKQWILAGSKPEKVRYGTVGARYKDPREKVIIIDDITKIDIDLFDEVDLKLKSLRYRINGYEEINYNDYSKIILGDGWYILIGNNGKVESGKLENDLDTIKEYNKYIEKYDPSKVDDLAEAKFTKNIGSKRLI